MRVALLLFLFDTYQAISPVGSAIEVENYRCWVTSPRQITCQDIGRVCVAARKKAKETNAIRFGCALEDWKKAHPGKTCDDLEYYSAPIECWPTVMGGY